LPLLRTVNWCAGDAPAAGARTPNSRPAGAIVAAGWTPSARSATGAGPKLEIESVPVAVPSEAAANASVAVQEASWASGAAQVWPTTRKPGALSVPSV
jgi:hypothetical protein